MNYHLDHLKKAIDYKRNEIIGHPLFSRLNSLEMLQRFMESHVAAVWDFMTLLKSLQRHLTCVEVPWVPTDDGITRRLINEIVLAEESDIDMSGRPISHYELYLDAMTCAGASTLPICTLVRCLKNGMSIDEALAQAKMPGNTAEFIKFTFDLVTTRPVWDQAAVFAFGREDLIPDMFNGIVSQLTTEFPTELKIFNYYLARHIELDENEHAPLALRMVTTLCGDDEKKWQSATDMVLKALELRVRLWDGVN